MGEPRVFIATDGYGETLSALKTCERIGSHLKEQGLRVRQHPMSDGSAGFIEALSAHREIDLHGVPVPGPLGQRTFATAGRLRGTWIVEAAQAVGLHLCGTERMPGRASSEGLGWLLNDLVRREIGPLIIGVGDGAAMDGGLGLACGLGLTALDSTGRRIQPPWGATALTRVAQLVGPPPLSDRIVQVLCSVQTTLADSIASSGPKKGVQSEDHTALDTAYKQWADVLNRWRVDHGDPEIDLHMAGGGSGGGLGLALHALTGAHLTRGATRFARMTQLAHAMSGADMVVTGSGPAACVVTSIARSIGTTVMSLTSAAQATPGPPQGPDQAIEMSQQTDEEDGFETGLVRLTEALLAHRP